MTDPRTSKRRLQLADKAAELKTCSKPILPEIPRIVALSTTQPAQRRSATAGRRWRFRESFPPACSAEGKARARTFAVLAPERGDFENLQPSADSGGLPLENQARAIILGISPHCGCAPTVRTRFSAGAGNSNFLPRCDNHERGQRVNLGDMLMRRIVSQVRGAVEGTSPTTGGTATVALPGQPLDRRYTTGYTTSA